MQSKIIMNFDTYSEEALSQVVEQSSGRPARNKIRFFQNGGVTVVGAITSAKRIPNTKDIEFTITHTGGN